MSISPATRKTVAERANYLCEYCFSPQDFSPQSLSIEHIFPKARQGGDEAKNLALACQGCNSYKSDKIKAPDPINGRKVSLYNPRKDAWEKHFAWSKDFWEIIGISAKGRATVKLLKLNRAGVVNLRKIVNFYDEHSPK
ncbi:hypothetical protein BH20ACI1_BH20ACI1_10330 [soil metagenome]